MRWYLPGLAAAALPLLDAPVTAQPADFPIAPAASDERPKGISVARADKGSVYVNARGLTLYGLDLRSIFGKTGTPIRYCTGSCAETWEPLLAPAGSTPTAGLNLPWMPRGVGPEQRPQAGGAASESQPASAAGVAARQVPQSDWAIVEGPQGPQYLYKRAHLVFTRKGDKRGSVAYDGEDNFTWNTLKYVPPVPKLVAPKAVSAVLVDGGYALTDSRGRVLYTGRNPSACGTSCDHRVPLAAGMANRGIGQWTVRRDGDYAQWLYQGRPVFVSQEGQPTEVPADGEILRP